MGGVLSLSGKQCRSEHYEDLHFRRRQMVFSCFGNENERLIPSLPDDISMQILARVPRISYSNMRLVSQKWNAVLIGPELFKLRKELGVTEEWLYILTKVGDEKLQWHSLDPSSGKWQKLPPMPRVYAEEFKNSFPGLWLQNMVGSGIKVAKSILRGWLGQKDTLGQMSLCGCSISVLDGCLYVLGGISGSSTMKCVWRYDPILNQWSEVAPMPIGRAYCKTGILHNKLYVVGGVSRGPTGLLVPIQAAEVYDPSTGAWADLPNMPFSRAHALPTAYLSEMLKPIATGLTSYMGKLCVPQSLYSWPFIVDIGGEIYDPKTDSWAEMPTGMGEGWPARQACTKLSIVIGGELYAIDPSSSAENGKLMVYDQKEDAWKVAIGRLPAYEYEESESPILLAGLHGKIHVIAKDSDQNIAIFQADHDDFPSSSQPTPSSSSSLHGKCPVLPNSETVVWKDVARRNFGSVEILSCQVLKA